MTVPALHVVGDEPRPRRQPAKPKFARVPHRLISDRTLPAEATRTFLALSQHANRYNVCWPSVRRLMDITGYAESTVRKHLSLLEDRGYIEREPQFWNNGGQRNSKYRIVF
jgi:DNA-binding transcriptional ArsR family regulator